MAVDFIHTEDVIDAIIDELTDNIPNNWLIDDGLDIPLSVMQSGDFLAFDANKIYQLCPCILIKSIGVEAPEKYISGIQQTIEKIRLVMVRTYEQCINNGIPESNICRAKYHYGKELIKALFSDTNRRLNDPTLTTSDSFASIYNVIFRGIFYNDDIPETSYIYNLKQNFIAIGIDIDVYIKTGA